jgi:hypothetical protein
MENAGGDTERKVRAFCVHENRGMIFSAEGRMVVPAPEIIILKVPLFFEWPFSYEAVDTSADVKNILSPPRPRYMIKASTETRR